MDINALTFGQKIPTASCQILNKKTQKLEPAVVYELDCRSISDVNAVKKAKGKWFFKAEIVKNMKTKYACSKFSSLKDYPNHFFIMENKKSKIIGLAQVKKIESGINVEYIEKVKKSKYKYTGLNIMAVIGLHGLDNGSENFGVDNIVNSAKDFYKNICGFKLYNQDISGIMDKEQIVNFVKKVQNETNIKRLDK